MRAAQRGEGAGAADAACVVPAAALLALLALLAPTMHCACGRVQCQWPPPQAPLICVIFAGCTLTASAQRWCAMGITYWNGRAPALAARKSVRRPARQGAQYARHALAVKLRLTRARPLSPCPTGSASTARPARGPCGELVTTAPMHAAMAASARRPVAVAAAAAIRKTVQGIAPHGSSHHACTSRPQLFRAQSGGDAAAGAGPAACRVRAAAAARL